MKKTEPTAEALANDKKKGPVNRETYRTSLRREREA